MNDNQIRDIVKDLRLELGYDQPPPPKEMELPPWLENFFRAIGEGLSSFLVWIGQGGWRFLIPVLVIIAGFIIYLLLRKVPVRQTIKDSADELLENSETASDIPADRWLAKAETSAAAGDHTGAVLCLYRAGLFVCLKNIKPEGELANREIRQKIPRGWRETFEKLYLAAERILFDDGEGTPEEYSRLLVLYREGFQ